jgi:hypothetical protein
MRILVVSDTHGNDKALFKAVEQAGEVDLLIHLGDGEADTSLIEDAYDRKVIRVAGNCDIGSQAPRELFINIGGKLMLITHGDRYRVKSGLDRLINHGRAAGADIILYGHTHNAFFETDENCFLLNPGTLSYQASFHSYAVITIENGIIDAKISELL